MFWLIAILVCVAGIIVFGVLNYENAMSVSILFGIIFAVLLLLNQVVSSHNETKLSNYVNNDDLIIIKQLEKSYDPDSEYQKRFTELLRDVERYNGGIDSDIWHNEGYDSRNIFTAIGYKKVNINRKIDRKKLIDDILNGKVQPDYNYYLRGE